MANHPVQSGYVCEQLVNNKLVWADHGRTDALRLLQEREQSAFSQPAIQGFALMAGIS